MDERNYWSGRRISRRAALRGVGLGVAGLAGAALIGCGDDDDEEEAAATAAAATAVAGAATAAATATATEEAKDQPKYGGIIRYADTAVAPHFSPFHPGVDPSFHNVFRRDTAYYDSLWMLRDIPDASRQLKLQLAESMERIDDLSVVVKMQRANFHDNPKSSKFNSIVGARMLTAEDVVARYAFVAVPPASSNNFIQERLTVSAVDELTLKYEMIRPEAFFLETAGAMQRPFELPQEMLDEDILKQEVPIGTGPYMFESYQVGSVERQVRNPDYWQKGFPYPDARSLTIIPDSAAAEAAFRGNQTDRIGFQDIKQAESVARDLGDKITSRSYQTASGMALLLNIRKPLFQDIRMREAIHRAIDVERVINVVYFGDAVRQHIFPNARPSRFPLGFEAVKDLRGLDKQRAKQLVDALKADGVYKGEELTFMLPVEAQTWVDSGTLIAEDLEEVGIKIKMESIVRNIYLQKAGPKPEDGSPSDFDITMTVFLDYDYFTTAPASFWQNAGLEDPEIDAIVAQVESTVDIEARAELSHRFERMMAEKYTNFVPMLGTNNHIAYYAYVKGIDWELGRSGFVGHTSSSSGQLGLWLDEGRAEA